MFWGVAMGSKIIVMNKLTINLEQLKKITNQTRIR